jgi:hypothetical protein
MATLTPFAYNTGDPIYGTDQIGNLAIGTTEQAYGGQPGDVIWWMGPDEDLGYVITYPQPDGLHPTEVGTTASVGFKRSVSKNESDFINLANQIFDQNFSNGNDAKTWLNNNGYWTSWTGFGSSGFQWMTINSITSSTASGVGQNGITISITQTGGGMAASSGMFSANTFPPTYGVPPTGLQILNSKAGIFTATFSQPVKDPLVAFASVGQPSLYVPVQSNSPFTPIWGTNTSYQNPVNGTQYTGFTGNEGFNIIKIDGTVSSISFNYTVEEYYSTICFGFVNQNV